jgi:hypothetical protein
MNSETKSVLFAADGHPDENQLLLALERELSTEEISQVEQHLGNCWSCRAHSEEIQRGILAFVEYREKQYLPSLRMAPNDFSNFKGRLRTIVGASPRIGFLARIWRWLLGFFALPEQVRWASIAAAVMAIVILWVEVINPPVISANDFLARAIAAEKPPASHEIGDRAYVAHQKVQIRSGDRTIVRDFEWTVGKPVQQPEWDMQLNPLNWNVPLSVMGFARWRDTLQAKKDRVKRSHGFLTLDTTASNSPIKEAWIVVRADDFHLVEQHLRFTDDRLVDFTEMAFKVSDQPQAESNPTAQSESNSGRTVEPHETASVPSQGEPDETEVELRYTLFIHQWDLGEDLTIARVPGRVTLSGTVSSGEREKAMRATLSTLPNVELSITAPSALSGVPSTSNHGPSAKGPTLDSIPLLTDVLANAFPTREERLAFVDRCLSVSDTELAHAWALKRLADRYSESEQERLKPESRAKIREMLHAHLQAVGQANAGLDPLLELLPISAPLTPAAPLSWRIGVLSLFAQIQQQDDLVTSLVVGTQKVNQDLVSASANLRSIHQNIPSLLSSIAQLADNSVP